MTRTIYYVASSLDGCIARPDGTLDWLFAFNDAEGVSDHYTRFLSGIGALVMGADTYAFVLHDLPDGWPYKGIPCWVMTHKSWPVPEGADVRFVADDVDGVYRDAHAAAAATGRDVWLIGGGNLVAQFAARGYLDALQLALMPTVIGRGIPLLPVAHDLPLTLTRHETLGRGVTVLHYDVTRQTPSSLPEGPVVGIAPTSAP